ncbi:hypothetical protein OROHE_026369 [Orobanche hederae]
MPSQEISKIRDGTPFEADEILTYIKKPSNGSVCYFSSKLDVSSNVVHKKRVKKRLARILFFKIRPSQEIRKIRDGRFVTFQKKRVARILFFKIRPSQEILKIRDGTPFKNGSVSYFSSNLDVPSNVAKKKRVARILFFKIRPSREILKIRDGTPLEANEILTYIKEPSKRIDKLDVPSNVVQKKRVARILFFKIRPSQEIRKIRDGRFVTFQKKRVARILFFKIRPSQEILKIRDGTPFKNGSVSYFSSNLDVPSNVAKKKRVARILFFKIRPSREILKIRDGTPLEAEEILTYIKEPSKRIGLLLF